MHKVQGKAQTITKKSFGQRKTYHDQSFDFADTFSQSPLVFHATHHAHFSPEILF